MYDNKFGVACLTMVMMLLMLVAALLVNAMVDECSAVVCFLLGFMNKMRVLHM